MLKKRGKRKTAYFSVALTPDDKTRIGKAADILDMPASIWARGVILKEAVRIIGEAATAKK